MRLLIANSNTSAEVTAVIEKAARAVAAPGTVILARNARFGAQVVGTRSEAAIAGHALLDMLAAETEPFDAVLLAMSMDSGLWAARELLAVPVVGMTEAGLLLASTMGTRIGMVVLGRRLLAVYRELASSYGFSDRLAGIEPVDASPQDLLEDPEAFYAPIVAGCLRLVERDAAEVVLLVGAVMGGLPKLLAERVPVPLVDGISAGVLLAEALVRLGAAEPRAGSLARPIGRASRGLAEPLARRLEGG
ncbi:MAG: aspartate/glutamate racemase family protein [Geminicoccaceae bacterium]|nr:aspartate/glutamate racemase family protein [Geminicoccaceae bacterium]